MTGTATQLTAPRAAATGRRPIAERPAAVRGMVFLKMNHGKLCEVCIGLRPKDALSPCKDLDVNDHHYPVLTDGDLVSRRSCVAVRPDRAIFSAAAAHRVKLSPDGYPPPDIGARPGWEPRGDV